MRHQLPVKISHARKFTVIPSIAATPILSIETSFCNLIILLDLFLYNLSLHGKICVINNIYKITLSHLYTSFHYHIYCKYLFVVESLWMDFSLIKC